MAAKTWETDFRSEAIRASIQKLGPEFRSDPFRYDGSFCLPVAERPIVGWSPGKISLIALAIGFALMGVGAWVYSANTFYAFCVTAIVGGVLAVVMVLASGAWRKHYQQFWKIAHEIQTIRDPDKLSEIAAERKPSMKLLPYGIPIAIGTILYFAWMGMLV